MSISDKLNQVFNSDIENVDQIKLSLKLKIRNKIDLINCKLLECDNKIENYQNMYKSFKQKNQQIIGKLDNILNEIVSKNTNLKDKLIEIIKFRDNCDFLLNKIQLDIRKYRGKINTKENKEIISNINIKLSNFEKLKEIILAYNEKLENKKNISDSLIKINTEIKNIDKKSAMYSNNIKLLEDKKLELKNLISKYRSSQKPFDNSKIYELEESNRELKKKINQYSHITISTNCDQSQLNTIKLEIDEIDRQINNKTKILSELSNLSSNLNNIEKLRNKKKLDIINIEIGNLSIKKRNLDLKKKSILKNVSDRFRLEQETKNSILDKSKQLLNENEAKIKKLKEEKNNCNESNRDIMNLKIDDIDQELISKRSNLNNYNLDRNKLIKLSDDKNIELQNLNQEIVKLSDSLPSDSNQVDLYKKELQLLDSRERFINKLNNTNENEHTNLIILEEDIRTYKFFLEIKILNMEVEIDCYNNSINKIEIEKNRDEFKNRYEIEIDGVLKSILEIKEQKKKLKDDLIKLKVYQSSIE